MDEITIKALVGVFAIIATLILFFIVYIFEYQKSKKERVERLCLLYDLHHDLDNIHESLRSISWEFTGLREDLEERSKKE